MIDPRGPGRHCTPDALSPVSSISGITNVQVIAVGAITQMLWLERSPLLRLRALRADMQRMDASRNRSTRARLVLALVLGSVLAVSAITASSASAYIYWANFNGPDGSIGRADLDGSGATQSFIPGRGDEGPIAVATFGDYIYWTNNGARGTGSIGRAKLDGTEVDENFITGATGPAGLAIDGEHIYWTNHYIVPSAENPNGSIGRANLDGTNVDQAFITATVLPRGIAVDSKYIYWANSWNHGSIGRANLKGTGINQDFITGPATHFATGLLVTPRYLYWTVDNGLDASGSIGRASVNGTGGNPNFITDIPRPVALAVNDRYIYWTNYEDAGSIGRANLNGSGVDQTFLTGSISPVGLAVDAGGPITGPLAPGPAITAAKLSRTVFSASSRGPSLTGDRVGGGARLSYRHARATLTRLKVLRPVVGHRSGGRCLFGRRSGKGRSCILFISLGSMTHRSPAGRVKVRFTGRLNGRKLAPGRYRLALKPRSSGKAGSTTYLSFRIRR
jgi:hypothetical protein